MAVVKIVGVTPLLPRTYLVLTYVTYYSIAIHSTDSKLYSFLLMICVECKTQIIALIFVHVASTTIV